MSKLDDLCAIKIMGWELSKSPLEAWVNPAGNGEGRYMHEWYPSRSLDDALVCLERAAQGRTCLLHLFTDSRQTCGYANIGDNEGKGSILALAMCLCSLRTMGVPESEISLAMEDI